MRTYASHVKYYTSVLTDKSWPNEAVVRGQKSHSQKVPVVNLGLKNQCFSVLSVYANTPNEFFYGS